MHADMLGNNKLSGTPDRELVELLKNGSHDAFGELYARFRERLIYSCKRYLKNETDSEDAVQDVFLQLWVNRHLLGDISSFSGYIQTIAKNYAIDKLRHFDVHSRFARNIFMNETDSINETENTIIDNDCAEFFDKIIEWLPPMQQKIFRLSRIEKLTYKEIAELLDIPADTVKKYASLALKKIKKQITQHTDIHLQTITILLMFFS